MAASLEGCGCGLLLLVALVALLLPLLPFLLGLLGVLVLLAVPLVLLAAVLERQNHRRLASLAAAASQRFGGDICRLGDRFALIERFSLEAAAPGAGRLQLSLQLQVLQAETEPDGRGAPRLNLAEERRRLPVPATQLTDLGSMGAFGRYLQSQGITVVNDLAVEARATRAALQCVREREWAGASLERLREMVGATRSTLAKAEGNELLEPSIPQLRQALASFEAELLKLRQHRRESDAMLRKLHDFLTVPENIRPILHFDLDGLFDPARLDALRESFEEVVSLNDSYRALSRDRLV